MSASAAVWIDGRLHRGRELESPAVVAALARTGCHTTTRYQDGRPAFVGRHAARLARDAERLGLPRPAASTVARALEAIGRHHFGEGPGVVRLKACAGHAGIGLSLVASARPLGADATHWHAVTAPFPHPGPADPPGAKLTERSVWTRARALGEEHGADEALLFDAAGRLVEGARCNLIVVDRDGAIRHPDPALGAVAGVALALLAERTPGLGPGAIDRAVLADAAELVAVNAVRGARPIVRVDDRAVGDGRPGPVARRLAACFETALQEEARSFA